MNEKHVNLRKMLDKDKVWYLSLGTEKIGKDFGYIKTNKELDKYLALFAVENNVNVVEASLSRNIMADVEESQRFEVHVGIKDIEKIKLY